MCPRPTSSALTTSRCGLHLPSLSSRLSPLSSLISHFASLSSHLSSLISHFSFLISHLSLLISPLRTRLSPLSSRLCPLSSVLCPLSSVLSPLSSLLSHRSSTLASLSSLPLSVSSLQSSKHGIGHLQLMCVLVTCPYMTYSVDDSRSHVNDPQHVLLDTAYVVVQVGYPDGLPRAVPSNYWVLEVGPARHCLPPHPPHLCPRLLS